VVAGAGDARVIRVLGDGRDVAVGQRSCPRLAAVERGVHTAAVVPVPVVAPRDHVERVARIDGERRLILRGGVIADVHHRYATSTARNQPYFVMLLEGGGIADAG